MTPAQQIVLDIFHTASPGWTYTAGGMDRPRRAGIPPTEIEAALRWHDVEMTPWLMRMLAVCQNAMKEAEASRFEVLDDQPEAPVN